jgi:hypothetical protein
MSPTPPGSPTGPLGEEMPISRAFLCTPFRIPSKAAPPPPTRFPLLSPIQSMLRFQGPPFIYLLIPGQRTLPPPRFPNGTPMERDARFQSLLLHIHGKNKISPFSQKSPVKEPPSMFPQRGPYRERSSVSRAIGWFIHTFLSESPVIELSHKIGGKQTVTVHRAARRHKAYIHCGSPRGSLMILLSLLHCHAAFSMIPSTLAWVDQSPVSQRVVVTLIRVSPPHLLSLPMRPRVRIHITLRYGWGVGFMGDS